MIGGPNWSRGSGVLRAGCLEAVCGPRVGHLVHYNLSVHVLFRTCIEGQVRAAEQRRHLPQVVGACPLSDCGGSLTLQMKHRTVTKQNSDQTEHLKKK